MMFFFLLHCLYLFCFEIVVKFMLFHDGFPLWLFHEVEDAGMKMVRTFDLESGTASKAFVEKAAALFDFANFPSTFMAYLKSKKKVDFFITLQASMR